VSLERGPVHVPNCESSLVTEAERKHARRRASLVAVACFLPGRAKDLSAHLYEYVMRSSIRSRDYVDYGSKGGFWFMDPVVLQCMI
jgi:hypothetical protein